MKAILVRIGVDHSYGGWNAPADPVTRRFLYVPINERNGTRFHAGCRRCYSMLLPEIKRFASDYGVDPIADLGWPEQLQTQAMHLDPDFDHLTYGDVGDRRGSEIRQMKRGDLIVFYAGLRSTCCEQRELIYALVGMYVVDEVVSVAEVPPERWDENAHTRKLRWGTSDIVVRAQRGCSGRFSKFVPVGEYRDGAYRVRKDLLKAWGGLSVRDGFIQRSARPPRFLDPGRFRAWLDQQDFDLLEANNESLGGAPVVLVLLRRPNRHKPHEMRSDPFWEFGSFGCTGCHAANLMNLRRADELAGTRFGFAQGGPEGIRLVKLTPPVTVVKHTNRAEVRWTPLEMPFRYESAPLLIDNEGETDFPRLKSLIEDVNQPTWVSCFSSKFRSRRRLLPADVAQEVVSVFAEHQRKPRGKAYAQCYADALPFAPPHIDMNRKQTYAGFLSKAQRGSSCRCNSKLKAISGRRTRSCR